jgi:hypothetical protein
MLVELKFDMQPRFTRMKELLRCVRTWKNYHVNARVDGVVYGEKSISKRIVRLEIENKMAPLLRLPPLRRGKFIINKNRKRRKRKEGEGLSTKIQGHQTYEQRHD